MLTYKDLLILPVNLIFKERWLRKDEVLQPAWSFVCTITNNILIFEISMNSFLLTILKVLYIEVFWRMNYSENLFSSFRGRISYLENTWGKTDKRKNYMKK